MKMVQVGGSPPVKPTFAGNPAEEQKNTKKKKKTQKNAPSSAHSHLPGKRLPYGLLARCVLRLRFMWLCGPGVPQWAQLGLPPCVSSAVGLQSTAEPVSSESTLAF